MPGELTELAFILDDRIGGVPLTPSNVDLPTLRGFFEEVEKLIKGDVTGASLSDSRVRLEEGSVKVIALVGHLLAADFQADIARLEATGDLDAIQTRRAEVLEQWQSRAKRTPSRFYAIPIGTSGQVLKLGGSSEYQHRGENSWVNVELYLTGKVVNAGGKKEPNVHLVLADSQDSVRVFATEEQLAAEKQNHLFKDVTLRVAAEQHLRTKALRDVRLIEFLHHEWETDESALATLWEKGREAWKGVPDASAWVETLRGN